MRKRVTAGLHGDVVEIGFGSDLNLPHVPATVDRILAVDPAVTGRQLAAGRLGASPIPVEFIGLDGTDLPPRSTACCDPAASCTSSSTDSHPILRLLSGSTG